MLRTNVFTSFEHKLNSQISKSPLIRKFIGIGLVMIPLLGQRERKVMTFLLLESQTRSNVGLWSTHDDSCPFSSLLPSRLPPRLSSFGDDLAGWQLSHWSATFASFEIVIVWELFGYVQTRIHHYPNVVKVLRKTRCSNIVLNCVGFWVTVRVQVTVDIES